ncbi:MAG: polysaccharide biosynthesis/export family protein [Bacteroidaceae bacterium]|nr:polysaccharide biosynthesis/export family protein [Bacteroidaceae bacterium]
MKFRIYSVFAVLAAICAASCATPKKVLYLQDMQQGSQIDLENKYEAAISPNDELRIIISCEDKELSEPFNLGYGAGGGSTNNYGSNGRYLGYLVDVYGNIQMPILGEIHVAGMTRLQLQNEITRRLKAGSYIEDPYVMVRFNNYKIFFLGPDGGRAITIPEERCTFLEALSLAGDLSNYTRRDKIAVLREVDGKMTMRYLDPRNSKVFNDPYYMLQQNDIIITQSVKSKYYKEEFSFWASWISLLCSITSVVTLVTVLTR